MLWGSGPEGPPDTGAQHGHNLLPSQFSSQEAFRCPSHSLGGHHCGGDCPCPGHTGLTPLTLLATGRGQGGPQECSHHSQPTDQQVTPTWVKSGGAASPQVGPVGAEPTTSWSLQVGREWEGLLPRREPVALGCPDDVLFLPTCSPVLSGGRMLSQVLPMPPEHFIAALWHCEGVQPCGSLAPALPCLGLQMRGRYMATYACQESKELGCRGPLGDAVWTERADFHLL